MLVARLAGSQGRAWCRGCDGGWARAGPGRRGAEDRAQGSDGREGGGAGRPAALASRRASSAVSSESVSTQSQDVHSAPWTCVVVFGRRSVGPPPVFSVANQPRPVNAIASPLPSPHWNGGCLGLPGPATKPDSRRQTSEGNPKMHKASRRWDDMVCNQHRQHRVVWAPRPLFSCHRQEPPTKIYPVQIIRPPLVLAPSTSSNLPERNMDHSRESCSNR